ncbi:MAG: hypothetical protein R3Y33_04120 [Clostridia bacterium]
MFYELSYMTLRHIMGEDKLLDFEIELCKEKIKNYKENLCGLRNRVEILIHLLTEKCEEPDEIEKLPIEERAKYYVSIEKLLDDEE